MRSKYHGLNLILIVVLLNYGSPYFQNQVINFIFGIIVILGSAWLMSLAEKESK